MFQCNLHRHLQHFANRHAAERYLERLPVIPQSVAVFTFHPDVRQEVHLNVPFSVAPATFTAPARHIRAEPPRRVSSHLRFRHLREKFTQYVENAAVRCRIAERRGAYRFLVNEYHFVHKTRTAHLVVRARDELRFVESTRESPMERVVHQRALPGTGYPRYHGHGSQRKYGVNVLEIVLPGADNLDRLSCACPALARNRYCSSPGKECPRERRLVLPDFSRCTGRDDFSSRITRAGSEVHDVIRLVQGIAVMFHDNDGVVQVAQVLKSTQQQRVVPRMQPDSRLVKNVQHTGQPASDLRSKPNALCFPTG